MGIIATGNMDMTKFILPLWIQPQSTICKEITLPTMLPQLITWFLHFTNGREKVSA